jgi:hypothetical protein
MSERNFLTELVRRNVYKVAVVKNGLRAAKWSESAAATDGGERLQLRDFDFLSRVDSDTSSPTAELVVRMNTGNVY